MSRYLTNSQWRIYGKERGHVPWAVPKGGAKNPTKETMRKGKEKIIICALNKG